MTEYKIINFDVSWKPEKKIRMREVNKIICLIKVTRKDKTSTLLNYHSPDWDQSKLFINTNLPSKEEKDIEAIRTHLSEILQISKGSIHVDFDRADSKMKTSELKLSGDPQKKVQDDYLDTRCNFYYAKINIDNPPEMILQKSCYFSNLLLHFCKLSATYLDFYITIMINKWIRTKIFG
ncbi:MAG: hypothetical protein GY834_08355 [Bacteroidetes bacterium]|nr:hypothetical protein [Bacteroidota bacterium]